MTRRTRRQQAGITAIGFLALACVFGLVGLAGLKIFPLYMQKMRVSTVLADLGRDFGSGAMTPQGIRNELRRRLDVESLDVPNDSIKITQVREGYQVRIQREARELFIADLWFVVAIDEQVEIQR
jgi:hypothetical protein